MTLNEKWIPVFENLELAKKIIPMQPEEAQKVLAENGFEFTMDEILEAGKVLYEMQNRPEGELSADDLDAVSGGSWMKVAEVVCKAAGAALSAW